MGKAKTGVTTALERSKKPLKKTSRIAGEQKAPAHKAAAIPKRTSSNHSPAPSAKVSRSKKVATSVSEARAKRAEIEAVLLRLLGKFLRLPAPIDRKAAIRRSLKISNAVWTQFGAAINQAAAIRSKGLTITRGQMAGAQSIADIAAYLLASGTTKPPFEAVLPKPMPGPVFDVERAKPNKAEPSRKAGTTDRASTMNKSFGAPNMTSSKGRSSETAPKKASGDLPMRGTARLKGKSRTSVSSGIELKKATLDLGVSRVALDHAIDLHGLAPGRTMATATARDTARDTATDTDTVAMSAGPPEQPPSFFFELNGQNARGGQARWGQEFDLLFKYDAVQGMALVVLKGQKLSELVQPGTQAVLGIDIVPVGLTLASGGAGHVVKFENGAMLGDPPRFHLRAPAQQDADPGPHGVHFIFTVAGAMIYSSFLKIELVDVFSDTPSAAPIIDLDLTEIVSVKGSVEREARLYVMSQGGCWQIYGIIDGVDIKPQTTTLASPANLDAAYRGGTLAAFTAIAANAIWSNIDGSMNSNAAAGDEALAAMQATVAAGSALHELLAADPVFKNVLQKIDALPDGSRISIYSDGSAFPWELIYPLPYIDGYPPENYQPDRFWGRRFIIESLLLTTTEDEKPPPKRRQPGKLRVSMGYNSGIDAEAPWSTPGRPLLPVRLQKDYFDTALMTRGGYFDQQDAILDTMRTPYASSLIYYFCHGSASQLKFEKAKPPIKPMHIMGDSYPGWPLIFLNACDAADISPLSFFSFRTKFRGKKAAGLIAPSFPVPTLFAAVFAKTFMTAYAKGDAVGEILFRLRRELLAKNNPLGLWYSLQCPLDLKAPLESTAPGA